MSRPALIGAVAVVLGVLAAPAVAQGPPNPHVDPASVPGSCIACHEGHGRSSSPMLPAAQVALCLGCHESRARLDEKIRRGLVAPGMGVALLGDVLAKPYVHPLDNQSFSEFDTGVTCTSCHSPHRSMRGRVGAVPGMVLASPKNPNRLEHELCLTCHGSLNVRPLSPSDVGPLVSSRNPSYHPVEAPSPERSPSLIPELAGRQINCTDCHGNSDRAGPRGPHGSDVRYLLAASYSADDGTPEGPNTYRLCYGCHRRQMVLGDETFPFHEKHVEGGTSCSTCHNPHGSTTNRALIRFDEDSVLTAVAPSSSGRLSFESDVPGSGRCYVRCHNVDHDPEGYGLDASARGFRNR